MKKNNCNLSTILNEMVESGDRMREFEPDTDEHAVLEQYKDKDIGCQDIWFSVGVKKSKGSSAKDALDMLTLSFERKF